MLICVCISVAKRSRCIVCFAGVEPVGLDEPGYCMLVTLGVAARASIRCGVVLEDMPAIKFFLGTSGIDHVASWIERVRGDYCVRVEGVVEQVPVSCIQKPSRLAEFRD